MSERIRSLGPNLTFVYRRRTKKPKLGKIQKDKKEWMGRLFLKSKILLGPVFLRLSKRLTILKPRFAYFVDFEEVVQTLGNRCL